MATGRGQRGAGGPPPGAAARALAARVLTDVSFGGARSGDALSAALRERPPRDPRDAGLATELVYGVLRQQRRLDHTLAPLVRQGLGALEPLAQVLLRIGAYQLVFLDRVHAGAAVSSTQDAARVLGAGRITGLLNGVLRKVAERGERLPTGDDDASVGVRWSLPDWLVSPLREAVGAAALEANASALRERAPNTVRPNLSRGGAEAAVSALAAEGFTAEPGPHGSLVVSGPGDPFATAAFRDGLITPQDPASLHVVELLGDLRGVRVLDLCAGRGVKSTAMADRGARVLALDVVAEKLASANSLAERLGVADRIETRVADAADPALELGSFDRVLVDAPCTGVGTIRRHPEIAWRREPADVGRSVELQARLLAAAAGHLAPGGELVYAVCSFIRAEGGGPTPEGLVEQGDATLLAPVDGVDAFQVRRFRRPA
ncbi:MAG: methyltransferase domain-containing protein [Deltaproteobacteria bacterium]|nr:methyltransferase domain-containing protein [Deltaproteobacteria bacterium]